jgi:hypothetical protein
MAIRDFTSRPPSAEYEAGFESAFPEKSHGKRLARHCETCGLLPAWCECRGFVRAIERHLDSLDKEGASVEQVRRPLKSPGQARWPMVVIK